MTATLKQLLAASVDATAKFDVASREVSRLSRVAAAINAELDAAEDKSVAAENEMLAADLAYETAQEAAYEAEEARREYEEGRDERNRDDAADIATTAAYERG